MRFALSIGASAVAFVVLIALAQWQAERLGWKRDLQAQIITRTQARLLHITNAADVAALREGVHHYRRAKLHGRFGDKTLYWFTQINNAPAALDAIDKVGYHVVQPFILADGTAIAVDRGFIPGRLKGQALPPQTDTTIEVIVRWADKRSWFSAPDNLAADTIYVRDTKIMGAHWQMALSPALGEVIAQQQTPPYGGQSRLTLANKHFGYLITWASLAVILVIISLLWHIREFRNRT